MIAKKIEFRIGKEKIIKKRKKDKKDELEREKRRR